jgi:hypothetical protein
MANSGKGRPDRKKSRMALPALFPQDLTGLGLFEGFAEARRNNPATRAMVSECGQCFAGSGQMERLQEVRMWLFRSLGLDAPHSAGERFGTLLPASVAHREPASNRVHFLLPRKMRQTATDS